MTVYADYDFYTNEYLCGREAVIDTASFMFCAKKASYIIKGYTLENIDESNIPECVRLCCCDIAEQLYKADKNNISSGISSESVGDQSISYESSDSQRQAMSQNIKSAVYSYLSGTGLLYRGIS